MPSRCEHYVLGLPNLQICELRKLLVLNYPDSGIWLQSQKTNADDALKLLSYPLYPISSISFQL